MKDAKLLTRMEKQNRRKKTIKKVFLVLALILVTLTGLFIYFLYDFFYSDRDFNFVKLNELNLLNKGKKEKLTKLNILIIGYDSGVNGRPRSDTLMVASFDLKEKAVGILSIPRDTRVLIPGHELHSKINSAFAEGGPTKAVETVSNFLEIPIHYYVATNFEGFAAMVDTLGGIEIDVKQDMHYEDKAGNLYIHINKGKQVLNGEQAIGYVRYRDDLTADLGRIQRQQKFINSAIKQFLTPELILKLPRLIKQFNESIKTDMSFQDMMNLARLIKDIKRDNIKTATIPGEGGTVNDVAYFLHDPEGTKELVHDLIASKNYIANSKYQVAILNGNGTFGLASEVASNLKLHGFNVGKVGNADNYNYEKTMVYYTKELTQEIENLSKIISGELKPLTESNYNEQEWVFTFDALIIVGKDFTD